MNPISLRTSVILLLSLLNISAFAQSMHLAFDESAGVFPSYEVKGRNGILIKQKLSFADFRTSQVRRSWTKGSSVTTGLTLGIPTDRDYRKLITTEHVNKNQTLFFEFRDSTGLSADVYCISKFKSRDFNVGNSPVSVVNILGDIAGVGQKSSSFYYVQIYTKDGSWHLILDNEAAQREPERYAGKLAKSENEFYSIVPHSKIKNRKGKVGTMPFGSAGFQIRNQSGEVVAAVSLIDNGIVYLKDVPKEERILLGSAMAALLLQEQI